MTVSVPDKLLAKSRRYGREEVTLQRHLFETEQSAEQVFRLNGRWGQNWCRFFRLNLPELQASFLLHLRLASLFHDIGKANEDFYAAVTAGRFVQQTLRHEHLSALILHLPEVRAWLGQNSSLDLEVVTGAVLSHHAKAAESGDWKWCQPKSKTALLLFCSHPEVNAVLDRIKEVAELSNSLRINETRWTNEMPWSGAWSEGTNTARHFARHLRKNSERRSLLLAVKVGLIVADAVASGLVREGYSIDDWINEKVHSAAITGSDINSSILNPKKEQLAKGNPKFDWHMFQKRAATLGERALLLAACGAGKTVAAWKWAEAVACERAIGKVIFLYPTRGTATEGFRDYVGWAPGAEAALVHGSSRYELEAIAENPNDATQGKNYETEERLFALGLWSKRYFSATVDQFLGFMEHSYTGMCLLPSLADSAVIIDEVHSFDRHMFDNLISFLKTFDVPVLCMTATLPPSRRDELIDAGLRVYPNDSERIELPDLEEKEKHPRYRLEFVADENAALKIAAAEYRAGKRVLWVVNTVKRCQRVARRLNKDSIKPLVYHSRFRLQDRKDRHAETVAAFKQTGEAKIAITTQVCEMSLDLDADVLITEYAPVSSLVQRFGRANRSSDRDPNFRARLIVYRPENEKPYTKQELSDAQDFLRDLGNEEISQRLMAEMLEKHTPAQRIADGSARLLEGGYYATPGMFRDIDEFTKPAILNKDLLELKAYLDAKKPYDALVINVPDKFANAIEERPGWLPKYLGIADEQFYDEHFGFMTELGEAF